MKAAKSVRFIELLLIIVGSTFLFSCSNAASSSSSSDSGRQVVEYDFVEVDWEPGFGAYEAVPYGRPADAETEAEDNPDDYSVSYQWQRLAQNASEDSWENVSGDEQSPIFYEPVSGDVGKKLRVKITWKYDGVEQSDLYSDSIEVKDRLDCHLLEYTSGEYALAGSLVDETKITGTVYNINGEEVSDYTVTAPSERLYFSEYLCFEISKDDYDSEDVEIFVPVKGSLDTDNVPDLSTDIANISAGKVKFTAARGDLEYSTDSGTSWTSFNTDEFTSAAQSVIKVRTKAVGTANESGYVKESDPVDITVTAANVGTATNNRVEIAFSTIGLSLSKTKTVSTDENNNVTVSLWGITARLSNAEVFQNLYNAEPVYRWFIDGSEIITSDSSAPAYYVGDGQTLIIDETVTEDGFVEDVYEVECRVTFRTVIDDDDDDDDDYDDDDDVIDEEDFAPLSQQISVSIKKGEVYNGN